jgi:hypothetical protein
MSNGAGCLLVCAITGVDSSFEVEAGLDLQPHTRIPHQNELHGTQSEQPHEHTHTRTHTHTHLVGQLIDCCLLRQRQVVGLKDKWIATGHV